MKYMETRSVGRPQPQPQQRPEPRWLDPPRERRLVRSAWQAASGPRPAVWAPGGRNVDSNQADPPPTGPWHPPHTAWYSEMSQRGFEEGLQGTGTFLRRLPEMLRPLAATHRALPRLCLLCS